MILGAARTSHVQISSHVRAGSLVRAMRLRGCKEGVTPGTQQRSTGLMWLIFCEVYTSCLCGVLGVREV